MQKKRRALIIDDDAAVTDMLHNVLTVHGFEVSCSENGLSALSFSEKQFDLIIVDYRMPGMNGADITKALRILYPESLIVGMSGEHKRGDFFAAGADTFLQKPISIKELIKII